MHWFFFSVFIGYLLEGVRSNAGSQYTIGIQCLIWRQILGNGEEGTISDHFIHESAQILGIVDARMRTPLKGQAHVGEGIAEVARPILVPFAVDGAHVDPLIEVGRLAHALPCALLVQADAKVPVGPGDEGAIAQQVRLARLGQYQTPRAQLLAQPLVEHH